MEKKYLGSRLLNDKSVFLSLSLEDWIGIALLLVGVSRVMEAISLEALSLPLAGVATIALITLRLSRRRHIIRDTLAFCAMWGAQAAQRLFQ